MPAEHAALYQYNLVNAQNHYIGFAQTETVRDHLVFLFWVAVDSIPTYSLTTNLFLLLQRHILPLLLIMILLFLVASTRRGVCTYNPRPTSSSLVSNGIPRRLSFLTDAPSLRRGLLQLFPSTCS